MASYDDPPDISHSSLLLEELRQPFMLSNAAASLTYLYYL